MLYLNLLQHLHPVPKKDGYDVWRLRGKIIRTVLCCVSAVSALMLLVGWQEGHPACKKTELWGTGVVIYLGRGTDLQVPLSLTVSCFSEIQIGFTFLVLAHPGSPGQNPEGCKTVVVVLFCVVRNSCVR